MPTKKTNEKHFTILVQTFKNPADDREVHFYYVGPGAWCEHREMARKFNPIDPNLSETVQDLWHKGLTPAQETEIVNEGEPGAHRHGAPKGEPPKDVA